MQAGCPAIFGYMFYNQKAKKTDFSPKRFDVNYRIFCQPNQLPQKRFILTSKKELAMRVTLSLHYHTVPGQQIFLSGSSEQFGAWDLAQALKMNYQENGLWKVTTEMGQLTERVEYKYLMLDEQGNRHEEWGSNHFIDLQPKKYNEIVVDDMWQDPPAEEKPLYTNTFTRVIMKPGRNQQAVDEIQSDFVLQFKITVPRISANYKVCVLGNQDVLGNWDERQPLILNCGNDFPVWAGQVNATDLHFPVYYKYAIWDLDKQAVATWEAGADRAFFSPGNLEKKTLITRVDASFRFPVGSWKGAGVAVPVFSLRSEKSFGAGEFNDLIDFIDWAKQVGLKMVQVLPVNETVASHNWLDSYPYKSVSVMALHPIYLNLKKLGKLNDESLMNQFTAHQQQLNSLSHVDYPEVHRLKSRYYKLIFDQDGEQLFKTNSYKKFFEANKEWLVPYAAFVYLRDKMKTPDFRKWGEFSSYSKEKIEQLCSPNSAIWEHIAVHYFIQYHLDKQLKEVSSYARENGIVLKGDIPIGISPNSVEAWTEPHLFNLNAQAGAPPDDFAVKGQNWGFPTYNWDEMAQDGYAWWIRRMQKMAGYFDTYRIDHILGFFRIWEVPSDAVEALLGHFNPALPMPAQEIESYGLAFDYERFALPYIRHHLLERLFGEHTDLVIHEYLDDLGNWKYRLKKEFNTQKKINQHFLNGMEEEELDDESQKIRDGLFELAANVLFVNTGYDQWHPRISMVKTTSFAELEDWKKERLEQLYNDYYFKRHEDFWYRKGMEKLPSIVSVGNMLVCGEDLGMIPTCVPRAMSELGILSLEIQRMPKNPKVRFSHPDHAPYLSVCATGTHDMPTIRGWWEEDREKTQLFFNLELGHPDEEAPYFAEPWVCKEIVAQHLYSPAMWTIFPIQDLIAMDGLLRWDQTHLEQINYPSDVRHKWRFRMKQSIQELKQADEFNELLREYLTISGRNADY